MMVMDKVLKTIKKHSLIEPGDKIVVGLSGGPDSVCLIHVLKSLKEKLDIYIHALHINHMLRGDESLQDEEYTRTLCKKLDVELIVKAADVKQISAEKGISLEVAGRRVRYKQLEHTAKEIGAAKIAVAHNKDDQAETVFMNIIRGTGIDGLKGMSYERGQVIRPLLDVRRYEIEKYCSKNFLEPRTDSSNLKMIFTRNKVRLKVIPDINKFFSTDVTESLCSMVSIVKEEHDFLEKYTEKVFKECMEDRKNDILFISIERLSKYHEAIQKRVLRMGIEQVKGSLTDIDSIHTQEGINLAVKGKTGSKMHLPGNLRLEKSYDILKIFIYRKKKDKPGLNQHIIIPGITSDVNHKSVMRAEIIKNYQSKKIYYCQKNDSKVQYFDYDKFSDKILSKGIYLRNRRNGDIFKPLKSSGTKKLKDYFIDKKIARDLRDEIPLVTIGHEIIWIVGHRISDKFKVTENTKNILKLEYLKL